MTDKLTSEELEKAVLTVLDAAIHDGHSFRESLKVLKASISTRACFESFRSGLVDRNWAVQECFAYVYCEAVMVGVQIAANRLATMMEATQTFSGDKSPEGRSAAEMAMAIATGEITCDSVYK